MIVRRYGEGYAHDFLLSARYDDQYTAESDAAKPDSNASRNRIIIGVVVGGIAAIAITAGIFFILLKKRKWDRIKRYEEHLLAMRASSAASAGYNNKAHRYSPEPYSTATAPQRPYSSMWSYGPPPPHQQPQQQQQQHQSRPSLESPPPAYHQPFPAYDPSQYPRVSHLPASVRPLRGSRGGSSSTFSFSSSHRPTGSGSVSGLGIGSDGSHGPATAIPLAQINHHQPLTQPIQSRPSYQRDPRGPSPEGSMSIQSDDTSDGQNSRPPRRPKPVLSRLITNFG